MKPVMRYGDATQVSSAMSRLPPVRLRELRGNLVQTIMTVLTRQDVMKDFVFSFSLLKRVLLYHTCMKTDFHPFARQDMLDMTLQV